MLIHDFTPLSSLAGGALIGLSASLVLLFQGRIAGISGILGGVIHPVRGNLGWRVAFLAGLLLTGAVLSRVHPAAFAEAGVPGLLQVGVAGLLVGVGTRLGNGCTSGHGVCGLARGSRRSLVATVTFMATAFATVFVTHHVVGALR